MRICGLMTESQIVFDLDPGDKADVLAAFVNVLGERGLIVHPDRVLKAILARESLVSTGLESGIAVPHALTDELAGPFLALAVIRKGTEFEAVDKRLTHVLLMLLGNSQDPGSQLRILAHICRLVKETDFVEKIKHAASPREICRIIDEAERMIT